MNQRRPLGRRCVGQGQEKKAAEYGCCCEMPSKPLIIPAKACCRPTKSRGCAIYPFSRKVEEIMAKDRMKDLFGRLDSGETGNVIMEDYVKGICQIALSDVPVETLQIISLLRVQSRAFDQLHRSLTDKAPPGSQTSGPMQPGHRAATTCRPRSWPRSRIDLNSRGSELTVPLLTTPSQLEASRWTMR
ncbi:unnamed protein product [Prorocentrum cordatum]|uniref:EF-hand domain-containing protein n=1 Tax=Prorocentrum cordatum TaxID=2364126 RepID=A0ABN9PEI0_9DINO|nr:unnamed protein product [Polarella glacialis]